MGWMRDKQNKMRKAYLKRRKIGGPDRDVLGEYRERVRELADGTFRDRRPWHGQFKQGEEKFHRLTMRNRVYGEVIMFFAGNVFYFEYSGMRSIDYPGRDQAVQAFEYGRIAWIQVIPMREPSSSLPS